MSTTPSPLPEATLGATGRRVTRAGLGGEGVLRTTRRGPEAAAVLEAALAAGITYFDCARAYADAERYHGAFWGKRPADRERVFLTSKSAARDGGGARRELEETLRRMEVDHLDLWQIHDVRTDDDLDELTHPGGALDTFVRAREQGLVRHLGVTGHHAPRVLRAAVEAFPVDAVLLPVNPMEGVLGGFLTDVLPAARARGLGVIGMKALGGAGGPGGAGGGRLVQAGLDADALLRFAFAQPVDVVIVGCATPTEVAALAAASHAPLDAAAQAALCEAVRGQAWGLAGYRGEP
ncbi:MAG: aldo/keto reductase [Candidatus Sericytochromatia bacterium]|nr:aldo/keto reductase [Candidatus Sericytochromatia bacterium]